MGRVGELMHNQWLGGGGGTTRGVRPIHPSFFFPNLPVPPLMAETQDVGSRNTTSSRR